MRFEAQTADALYRSLITELTLKGEEVAPRGLVTREFRGVSITLREPCRNIVTLRKMNYRFMVAEFLWILTGQSRSDLIGKFNGHIPRFSDDGTHMAGAYGPPIVDQLPWVIQQLRDDKDTRQAVLTLWRPRPGSSRDVPCTTLMQFMLREHGLEMITFMRSNDVWLGFPYDLFTFTQIQRYVANAIKQPTGPYHHHVGSFHLYHSNLEEAVRATDRASLHVDSGDLDPTYPWPHSALEALLSSPQARTLYPPDGWGTMSRIMIPSMTPPKWARLISANGIEPRSFADVLD